MLCPDGILYEPRALWETFFVANDGLTPARVVSDKSAWVNGSRYPIRLTHMIVSPLNYPTLGGGTKYGSAAQIENASFTFAVRGAHYSVRDFLPLLGLPTEPAGEPSMRYSATSYAAGLFGISRWTFGEVYSLPEQGTISFEVSGWTAEFRETITNPSISVMFYETSDIMLGGQARLRDAATLAQAGGTAWPSGNAAFPSAASADACDASGGTNIWLQAAASLRAADFSRQESSRGGGAANRVEGFAVMIDQIAHDDDNAAVFPGEILAPFSQRIRTRCKTVNGGTGEWWWRPGAPLVLVSPTIGAGSVYPLDRPIVLGPGDQLELEGEIATAGTVVHVGLSFCGYAMVEG